MATFKLTIKRGQRAQDVTVAQRLAIAGSDAAELNIDVTNMPQATSSPARQLALQICRPRAIPQ
jgi:hypothetical protein